MNVNIFCYKGLELFCFQNTCIDKFGRMHKIWKDNLQYRVFTKLWRSFAQEIMNKEDVVHKYGHIDLNKYNCKTEDSSESTGEYIKRIGVFLHL